MKILVNVSSRPELEKIQEYSSYDLFNNYKKSFKIIKKWQFSSHICSLNTFFPICVLIFLFQNMYIKNIKKIYRLINISYFYLSTDMINELIRYDLEHFTFFSCCIYFCTTSKALG